ncbi:MAG: site-specific integrase [Nanoarchaeota archaeon]|nr:site-specific integrase [Nanoarchaeota archaeon]MBU1946133.1 site-specific integrase [Nanoarchaeota archaeon]
MAKKKFLKRKLTGVKAGRLPSVFNKEQLVTILHNTNDSRMAMVIVMGIFQGFRISEMWNLKWKDVDLNSGMIIVKDAKNVKRFETGYGKDRYVPVNNKFIQLWKKWRYYNTDEEYVIPSRFENRKRPIIKSLNRLYQDKFVKILKRSDMYIVDYLQSDGRPRHKFHLHTLRHTCGCNLRKMGVPLENIQEFLGHSDIETTRVYAQITRDTLKEVIERGYDYRLPTSKALPPIQVSSDKESLMLQKEILDKRLRLKQMSLMEAKIYAKTQ